MRKTVRDYRLGIGAGSADILFNVGGFFDACPLLMGLGIAWYAIGLEIVGSKPDQPGAN